MVKKPSSMSDAPSKDMVLVYDIRRDQHQKASLLRFRRQWRDFEQGKKQIEISEGRISKLFFVPYDGEHMFELDDGVRRMSWTRFGDDSWYAVGHRVRVEHVVFRSLRFGNTPAVTKIWIGSSD